jgi:TPR repeat protein
MFKPGRNISIPKLSPLPEPIQQPAHLPRAKPVPEHIDIKDPLAIGIFYHENGDLLMSAFYFSIAASRGDATGLFLFAISTRHGWGVKQDEKEAFRLLSLVTDRAGMEEDLKQVTSTFQIPLALFEVGTAFHQGWGVPQDKKKAAYYFNQAAQLGDPDAQIALAECFLRYSLFNSRGDGVKPNKKMAATWFRKAEEQGARLVQMQWIWKEKYDSVEGGSAR